MHSKKALISLLKDNTNQRIHFKHIDINGEKIEFDVFFEFNSIEKESPFYVEINVSNEQSNDYQNQLIDLFKTIHFIFEKYCILDKINNENSIAGYNLNEEIFKNLLSYFTFKNFERV